MPKKTRRHRPLHCRKPQNQHTHSQKDWNTTEMVICEFIKSIETQKTPFFPHDFNCTVLGYDKYTDKILNLLTCNVIRHNNISLLNPLFKKLPPAEKKKIVLNTIVSILDLYEKGFYFDSDLFKCLLNNADKKTLNILSSMPPRKDNILKTSLDTLHKEQEVSHKPTIQSVERALPLKKTKRQLKREEAAKRKQRMKELETKFRDNPTLLHRITTFQQIIKKRTRQKKAQLNEQTRLQQKQQNKEEEKKADARIDAENTESDRKSELQQDNARLTEQKKKDKEKKKDKKKLEGKLKPDSTDLPAPKKAQAAATVQTTKSPDRVESVGEQAVDSVEKNPQDPNIGKAIKRVELANAKHCKERTRLNRLLGVEDSNHISINSTLEKVRTMFKTALNLTPNGIKLKGGAAYNCILEPTLDSSELNDIDLEIHLDPDQLKGALRKPCSSSSKGPHTLLLTLLSQEFGIAIKDIKTHTVTDTRVATFYNFTIPRINLPDIDITITTKPSQHAQTNIQSLYIDLQQPGIEFVALSGFDITEVIEGIKNKEVIVNLKNPSKTIFGVVKVLTNFGQDSRNITDDQVVNFLTCQYFKESNLHIHLQPAQFINTLCEQIQDYAMQHFPSDVTKQTLFSNTFLDIIIQGLSNRINKIEDQEGRYTEGVAGFTIAQKINTLIELITTKRS